MVSALNGKITPGSGYSTYKRWLELPGKDKLVCPENDAITFFDNIGKYVIKNYRVSSQKHEKADIVTATLHICLDSNLQRQDKFIPGNWVENDIGKNQEKMKNIVTKANEKFRQARLDYIEMILNVVKFENDDVQKKINKMKSQTRKCENPECSKEFSSLKRKCDECASKVVAVKLQNTRFECSEPNQNKKN